MNNSDGTEQTMNRRVLAIVGVVILAAAIVGVVFALNGSGGTALSVELLGRHAQDASTGYNQSMRLNGV